MSAPEPLGVPRGGDRQHVGSLVERVADVPLDPVPANLLVVRGCDLERTQISLFFTGSPEAVFQPLRFQPAIQEVMPSCR